jgi:multidrug efflux system outer membrane protein
MVAGCLNLGPKYQRPDLGFPIPPTYQQASKNLVTPVPEDRWWEVFRNPEINQLVEEVLRHNLDIKKATARILEVRAQVVQARADRFPRVDLQGQIQRQSQQVGVTAGPQGGARVTTNIESVTFPATFEVDLWGRLARAEEAAREDLLQSEENRHTVAQTVVAEALSLYLQMESLERQIKIVNDSISNYRDSLEVVNRRYERGLVSILDLRQARRTLAQAEARLPSLRQDLGTTQQQLSVLLGRYPKTRKVRQHAEDYYKKLDPVPPGLPSELLLRRPDIRAAEAKLRALNARVAERLAARFPRITLTGNLGYSSDELSEIFRPESFLWSWAAGLVQPLFNAGKLIARQREAEARYQQGSVEYAQTVLTGFSEVENALLTREEQLQRRVRLLNFLDEARATQRVAESRYQRGLVEYLDVLEAQQTRFQAEENVVLVDFAILNNRVNLHRSLGGGWAGLAPISHPKSVFLKASHKGMN